MILHRKAHRLDFLKLFLRNLIAYVLDMFRPQARDEYAQVKKMQKFNESDF